ncbi:MAG: SpoIID/LytB domain-containing protein, partial [Acidobacteriota bacterium]|nr:SpoIID/LytB domain-containing protein [Acidobacteriota bacterium]
MTRTRPAAAALMTAVVALAAGMSSANDAGFERLARQAGQGEPLFRVGLDSAHRVLIDSTGRYRVVDPTTAKPVWKPEFSGELAVVADGGPTGAVESVFRIQAGAFGTQAAAEKERDRLVKTYGVPAVVRYNPDRGSWRVRVGEKPDRDALEALLSSLRDDGLEGLWIVEEPAEASSGIRLRLVDASYESYLTDLDRLAIVPTGRDRIRVEGKPYRGIIELRISPFGTVQAINWIEFETYLLGVVPAELGPEMWPQMEALKAQAVAARTYAWKHRGQFADEGFDLCATPRCQVYEGESAEHPMSDRAVVQTRGEILTWKGEPITAMYTATCGGHTEDAAEIFPEDASPYLVAVPCRAETDA